MSEKILIKWKTNDLWRDVQQRIPRKDIKPFDVALEKGQAVQILFNRHWSHGEVCEAWQPMTKKTPKAKKSEKKKSKSSSDDEEVPLASLRASTPTSVQKKQKTAESEILAQYKAGRDARIRTSTPSSKPQQDQRTASKQAKPEGVINNPPAAVLESRDEEKVTLSVQLEAEKKKREVMHAEKVIAETRQKTLQTMLEKERTDLSLMKNKIAAFEAEKIELREALEAAKKKNAMHEQNADSKKTTDVAAFMNAITISLSSIENKLYEYNGRLSSIETCLCNMFTTASTPDPLFSPVATAFSTELPTHTNTSFATEEVVNPPNEVQTPLSRRTAPTVATTSISPLLFNLPDETAAKIRKLNAGKDRDQYVRGAMDVAFTEEEMSVSNVGGKRQKERLDDARVDLVKRLALSVHPPGDSSPCEKAERRIRDTMNAKCREVRFKNTHGKDKEGKDREDKEGMGHGL